MQSTRCGAALFAAIMVAASPLAVAGASLPEIVSAPLNGGEVSVLQVDRAAPVVVFENGLGGNLQEWLKVIPDIAETNSVFAYDRPGVRKSSPTDHPRDVAGIVEDLRVLLKSRHLAPPYVLVGHSMGGLDMQYYARRYPGEVAGLVLVDSTHPNSFYGPGSMENRGALQRAALAVGIKGSARDEFNALPQSRQEVLSAPPIPAQMPVVVIVAPDSSSSPMVAYDNAMRADFANLYPTAVMVQVPDGHKVPQTHPEAVIAAIRQVLAKSGHIPVR